MALQTGNADCTLGLAKRLYDARVAGISLPPPGAMRDACVASLKADCFAIAGAVVAEIAANAHVQTIVNVGSLQTSTNPGDPTNGPPSPVALSGTVS